MESMGTRESEIRCPNAVRVCETESRVMDRLLSALPSGFVRLAFESTAVCLSPCSLILTHVHTFHMHESY